MSAIGVMLIGFGILTAWAGFNTTSVFDLLRSIVGAPIPARTDAGKIKPSTSGGSQFSKVLQTNCGTPCIFLM